MRESGGKRRADGWCSGEESCFGSEGGYAYGDVTACQLEVIAGERPGCVRDQVSAKQTSGNCVIEYVTTTFQETSLAMMIEVHLQPSLVPRLP